MQQRYIAELSSFGIFKQNPDGTKGTPLNTTAGPIVFHRLDMKDLTKLQKSVMNGFASMGDEKVEEKRQGKK